MKAHIIVDRYRPKENLTLRNEMRKQGIDYQIWCAVHDTSSVVTAINRSHKIIVEHAKREKLPEILIMEEDVWFPAADGFQYFLRNTPKVPFDLYLGGCYGLNQGARNRLEAEEPGALSIHNFAGLHCYIITSNYYSKFLSIPDNEHIDNQPGMGNFFVCFPFAALQHPGWSANNRMDVDYNTPHQIPIDYVYRGER